MAAIALLHVHQIFSFLDVLCHAGQTDCLESCKCLDCGESEVLYMAVLFVVSKT